MMKPGGEVPVMVEDGGEPIAGSTAITEYLEETATAIRLMPQDPHERAEIRRLVDWFDRKFATEVSDGLIFEKVTRRFLGAYAGGGARLLYTPDVGDEEHNLDPRPRRSIA